MKSQLYWTKASLHQYAGASYLSFVCEIQVFKLCLASTGETPKTVKVKIMKNVEFYDCKSGKCGREGLVGGKAGNDGRGRRVLNQDRSGGECNERGSKMLTIKYFPCGDSLKVPYFFTTFHRKIITVLSSASSKCRT